MNTNTSLARSSLVAALFASLVCVLAACGSDGDGTTPTCQQDVTADGHQEIDNGCNPFALCVVNGQVANPDDCCKDQGEKNSYEYKACMYGYGVGDLSEPQ